MPHNTDRLLRPERTDRRVTMSRKFGMALYMTVMALLAVQSARAQETAGALVTVTGNVLHETTAEPAVGAIVRIAGLDITLVTDANGQFVLEEFPRGAYDIEIVHQDFQRMEGRLTVDQPGEFFLAMTPSDDPNKGLVTGIAGVVTDQTSGEPVPEVVVRVAQQGRAATTDAKGRFSIPEMFPGLYEVSFTHLGYGQRADSVAIEVGRVSNLDVALAVEAIELTPIEVTVERQDVTLQEVGFYQRESDGWGSFVDREEIERWNPMELSDALIRFPGVRVVSNPQMPSRRFVMFRRAGQSCYPAVYLDGALIHRGGDEPAVIDDLVDPIAVAGVEVYKGQAGLPPQYWGLNSSCGVVLIWIRRA